MLKKYGNFDNQQENEDEKNNEEEGHYIIIFKSKPKVIYINLILFLR